MGIGGSHRLGAAVGRRLVGASVCVALLRPGTPMAAPAAATGETAGFDELFVQGQAQFDGGEFAAAARSWKRAADRLPAGDVDNRRDLFDAVAEAYEKAVDAEKSMLAEAVQALDDYAAAFVSAAPGANLHPRGVEIHRKLKARLAKASTVVLTTGRPAERETRAPTTVAAKPSDDATRPIGQPSPTRPWKGLAIGGGVAIGAGLGMLGLFGGGYARVKSAQDQFNDQANGCVLADPSSACQGYLDRGKRADAAATVGLVAAPLLVAAGVAMLVIAVRRKSTRQAAAPLLGPGLGGVSFVRRF